MSTGKACAMCSILDIDLDYFNEVKDPTVRLRRLLAWAGRPVDLVVEKHHAALREWRSLVRRGALQAPTHILHVDEHHDMLDENVTPNIGNMMLHAMKTWPQCRVHWLVEAPIDSPRMWVSDETWERVNSRFGMGRHKPRGWPRPHLVSVCTSPAFVAESLGRQLIDVVGAPSSA